LKNLQNQKSKLETDYKKELAAIEKKYRDLNLPIYARRADIVVGKSEPTAEELVEPEPKPEEEKAEGKAEVETKGEAKVEIKSDIPADAKGIPEFWLQTLRHHEDFSDIIEPEDEEALKFLTDITWKPLDEADVGAPSFSLEFHFAENPYFEDKVLSKTYFLEEDETFGDIMFDRVEATAIAWKAGKNLTVKMVTKQQKLKPGRGGRRGGRGGGGKNQPQQTRTVTVEEPCNSFFNFFSPDIGKSGEDEEEEEMEEDMQAILEADYDMGLLLKTQIIPNAVLWYTGEMAEPEGDEDEEEEEGEEGEEEYDSADDPEYDDKAAPPAGTEPKCENQVQ